MSKSWQFGPFSFIYLTTLSSSFNAPCIYQQLRHPLFSYKIRPRDWLNCSGSISSITLIVYLFSRYSPGGFLINSASYLQRNGPVCLYRLNTFLYRSSFRLNKSKGYWQWFTSSSRVVAKSSGDMLSACRTAGFLVTMIDKSSLKTLFSSYRTLYTFSWKLNLSSSLRPITISFPDCLLLTTRRKLESYGTMFRQLIQGRVASRRKLAFQATSTVCICKLTSGQTFWTWNRVLSYRKFDQLPLRLDVFLTTMIQPTLNIDKPRALLKFYSLATRYTALLFELRALSQLNYLAIVLRSLIFLEVYLSLFFSGPTHCWYFVSSGMQVSTIDSSGSSLAISLSNDCLSMVLGLLMKLCAQWIHSSGCYGLIAIYLMSSSSSMTVTVFLCVDLMAQPWNIALSTSMFSGISMVFAWFSGLLWLKQLLLFHISSIMPLLTGLVVCCSTRSMPAIAILRMDRCLNIVQSFFIIIGAKPQLPLQLMLAPDTAPDLSVLDGINRIITLNKYDYLLLMKRAKDKPYFTLYVTDSLDDYWIEKFDMEYFQKTAKDMNIQGDLAALLRYVSEALTNECTLQRQENTMNVLIKIKMGDSVNISHRFVLNLRVNFKDRPEEFRKLNRVFVLQLYEAKQKQLEKMQEPPKKEDDSELKREQNQKFLATVFKSEQKKVVKKGDLINPNKKKRKQLGVHFGTSDDI